MSRIAPDAVLDLSEEEYFEPFRAAIESALLELLTLRRSLIWTEGGMATAVDYSIDGLPARIEVDATESTHAPLVVCGTIALESGLRRAETEYAAVLQTMLEISDKATCRLRRIVVYQVEEA